MPAAVERAHKRAELVEVEHAILVDVVLHDELLELASRRDLEVETLEQHEQLAAVDAAVAVHVALIEDGRPKPDG